MPKARNPYLSTYGHCVTIGQTMFGKSTLNKKLAAWYKAHDIKVIVLDPMSDPGWNADEMFDEPDAFMAYVKNPSNCLQCACFIDEAGSVVGRYMQTAEWCTTQSRHFGHVFHLLSQRAEMVNRTMRSQCSTLFAFNVGRKDCKNYAEDWNDDAILGASKLPKGQCIQATRGEPSKIWRVW